MKAPVMLVAAVLLLAGCTASPRPKAPEIPSAATPAPDPSAPAESPSPRPESESDFDKALRYTRCMTEMGVPTEDPVVGKPLPVFPTFGRGESHTSADLDQRLTAYRTAFTKCKPLLPRTWPIKEDPAQLAKERAFKECLSKRGIETHEADANGMVHYPTDLSYLETPEYRAAENACRHFYDDPANKGGS